MMESVESRQHHRTHDEYSKVEVTLCGEFISNEKVSVETKKLWFSKVPHSWGSYFTTFTSWRRKLLHLCRITCELMEKRVNCEHLYWKQMDDTQTIFDLI
jgi:hypothetical protein